MGNDYVFSYKQGHEKWVVERFRALEPDFINSENINLQRLAHQKISDKSANENDENPDLSLIEIDESLLFQTEFDDKEIDPIADLYKSELKIDNSNKSIQKKSELPVFNRSRAVASRLRFSFNELVTKVDNEPLFEGLESYNEFNSTYNQPQTGFLVKSTVKDLFEDHIIEGGLRLASNFRGMEYFLSYDDQRSKLDWKYALYRKTESRYDYYFENSVDIDKLKLRTNIGLVRAKYPFDIYRSLHLTGSLRFDNMIVTASNLETLNQVDISEQRMILSAEYIFDNTSVKGVNLLSGSRYKFFAKFSNRFDIRLKEPRSFELSAGRMAVLGFDFRHYVDVLEHSTLAFRLAGQSSFGNEKNIYFLGGMENWFFASYDNSYPVPQDQNFAFMLQAANLRGFPSNVRNGSTFALLNIEYRLPVFVMLFDSYIRQSFFRDFQLTAFFDAGTAWYGLTPFSEENAANVYYHEAPPAVLLRIRQFKDPLVAGMGFGVRTSLFGYFLKFDYAWGIENTRLLKPMMYFSMGYDF